MSTEPSMVGTLTLAPSAASQGATGSSISTSPSPEHVKQRMGSELDMEEQVASGRVACAGFALPRQAYDRAMAYPGGNGHIEGFGARHHTHATTRGAGLLVLHAAAVAGGTHGRRLQRDRACGPVMRLFEAEFDGRLDVLTTHGKARASAPTAPGAKQRLKKVAEAARAAPGAEEVAEVAVFNAPAFPARRRGEISARLPVLAELVVALDASPDRRGRHRPPRYP